MWKFFSAIALIVSVSANRAQPQKITLYNASEKTFYTGVINRDKKDKGFAGSDIPIYKIEPHAVHIFARPSTASNFEQYLVVSEEATLPDFIPTILNSVLIKKDTPSKFYVGAVGVSKTLKIFPANFDRNKMLKELGLAKLPTWTAVESKEPVMWLSDLLKQAERELEEDIEPEVQEREETN